MERKTARSARRRVGDSGVIRNGDRMILNRDDYRRLPAILRGNTGRARSLRSLANIVVSDDIVDSCEAKAAPLANGTALFPREESPRPGSQDLGRGSSHDEAYAGSEAHDDVKPKTVVFGATGDDKPTGPFKPTGWGFNSLTSSLTRAFGAAFLGLAHSAAAEAVPATSSPQGSSARSPDSAPSQQPQNASSSASGAHNRPILPAYSVKSRSIDPQHAGVNSVSKLRKPAYLSLGDNERIPSGNYETTGLKRKRGDEATNSFSAPDDSDSDHSDEEKGALVSVAKLNSKTTDKVSSFQNHPQSMDKLSKRGAQLSAELNRPVARVADTDEERTVSTPRAAKRVKLGEAIYANATHEPARNAQPLKPAITYKAAEVSADQHAAPGEKKAAPQQPPKRKVIFKRRYQPPAGNSFGLTDDILDESDSDIEVDLNDKGLVPENIPGVDPEDISRVNERLLQQQDPSRKKPGKGKAKQAVRQPHSRSGRRASQTTTTTDEDDSRAASKASGKKSARGASKSSENKTSTTKPAVSRVAASTPDGHTANELVVESESNNNNSSNNNNNIFVAAEAVARSGIIRTVSSPLSAIDINSRFDQSGRAAKPKPDATGKTAKTTTPTPQGAGATTADAGSLPEAATTGPVANATTTSLTPRTAFMPASNLLAAPAAAAAGNVDPVKRARHLALKYKPVRPSSLRTVSQISNNNSSSSPPAVSAEPSSSSMANNTKKKKMLLKLKLAAATSTTTTATATTLQRASRVQEKKEAGVVGLPVVVVRAVRASATPMYMLVRQKKAAVEVTKLRKRAAVAVRVDGRKLGFPRTEYLAWKKDKENHAPKV